MSQAIPVPLTKVLVVDPMCDNATESVYAVEKSASIANYYTISSNNSSNTSTTWVVNSNDMTTITGRVWMIDCTVAISVPITRQLAADKFALRSFPLSKWANSIVLQIGNNSSVIQIGQLQSALERYDFSNKYLNYSECPIQFDTTTPYAADVPNQPFNFSSNTYGEKYSSRLSQSQLKSAVYLPDPAGATSVVLTYRILEPVFIPPLVQSLSQCDRKEGIRKISQYQLTMNWGNPNRLLCWAGDAVNALSQVSVSFTSAPNLYVHQLVPGALDIGRSLSVQSLPYSDLIVYPTDPRNLAYSATNEIYGAPQTFVSPTIQCSRIPAEVYIWCRPQDSFMNSSIYATDTFATYVKNSLQINFNGVQQFQNITDIALYNLCVQNGLNTPWPQWSSSAIQDITIANGQQPALVYDSGVGSVICLKFSKNITLGLDLAPGTNTKANLQIQAQFANPYAQGTAPYDQAIGFVMYTLVVYEGAIEMYQNNTVAVTLGCLSNEDVLTAVKRNEKVHYSINNDEPLGGANMFSKAKKFLTEHKLHGVIKMLKDLHGHPLTKEVSKFAKGYLRGRNPEGKSDIADTLEELGLGMVGGGMVGGRKMSKADLKRALLS